MLKRVNVVAVAVVALVTGVAVAEQGNGALRAAMGAMKEQAAALGAAKAEGTGLFFGSTKMNGNYEIVDAIKEKHQAVATFFVKKEEQFIRVSTNVQNEGNRAVGTKLDPAGKPYAALVKGEVFEGEAQILGGAYNALYEPIKNEKGEVIGAYFVGVAK